MTSHSPRSGRPWLILAAAAAVLFAAPLLLRMQTDDGLIPLESGMMLWLGSLGAALTALVGMVRARVSGLYVAAAAWPLFGVVLAAGMAGRGWAPPAVAWAVTFLPALAMAWQARGRGPAAAPAALHLAAGGAAMIVAGVGAAIIVRVSAGAEQMASITDYQMLDRAVARAGAVEPLRAYRLAPDSAVGPDEAGEALISLALAGDTTAAAPALRPPARRYRALLPDADGGPLGIPPAEWHDRLIPLAAKGLTEEQRVYLRAIAAHPATAELTTASRARTADIAGAAYRLPLPDGVDVFDLPTPAWRGLLDAARVQTAAAALDVAEGRPADAERRLRELISAGLLLRDESPQLVTALIGVRLAEHGGHALAAVQEVSGRPDEAIRLRSAMASRNPGPALRSVQAESLFVRQTLGCGSLRAVVYGQDAATVAALARGRAALVRSPAEGALYRLIEEMPSASVPAGEPQSPWARAAVALLGDGLAQRCPRGSIALLSVLRE